jgi:hypothetical protein
MQRGGALKLTVERKADLLADVEYRAPGETPEDICKRYGVSLKTLQRARAQCATDVALSDLVRKKKSDRARGWRDNRLRFLRNAIDKLDSLVSAATGEQIREVAGAIKIVGDLESLSRALGVEDDNGKQPGGAGASEAPQATGRGGEEQESGTGAGIH